MSLSPPRRQFDFSANHLALDFVNTVNGRPDFDRDDLGTAADVADWAHAAGLMNNIDGVPELRDAARFETAVALRENLYGVFGPIAAGGVPDDSALTFVTRRAAQALRSTRWDREGATFVPRWPDVSIVSVCDRLADEAMQLLRSPKIERVGSCAGCGWLFLDVSRAHARRWCSMNACGVRDKMRRYHQRQSSAASHTSASSA